MKFWIISARKIREICQIFLPVVRIYWDDPIKVNQSSVTHLNVIHSKQVGGPSKIWYRIHCLFSLPKCHSSPGFSGWYFSIKLT